MLNTVMALYRILKWIFFAYIQLLSQAIMVIYWSEVSVKSLSIALKTLQNPSKP
jgi:hypothetical protein